MSLVPAGLQPYSQAARPVPDVTNVLEEGIARNARRHGKKIDTLKEIERLKDLGRYVLEVY